MTNCVVEPRYDSVHEARVLTKIELLTVLEQKDVKHAKIGRVLDLPSSRVAEIFRAINESGGKPRELKYDEGVKLIRAFGLEQSQPAPAPPASILRLAVRHIAMQLQAPVKEGQIAELAEDLRAFYEYVANPKVQRSLQAAEGFFQALRIRRPAPEEEAQQETDHESAPRQDR